IAATEKDYQTMGTDDKDLLLKQYMHLYKGLSWLEKNNPDKAIVEFDLALKNSKNKLIYNEPQWYALMAPLKKNNMNQSGLLAKQIAQTNSIHKKDAQEIVNRIEK